MKMREQLGLVLLVTIIGGLKPSNAGGWTNTYTVPKPFISTPLVSYSRGYSGYPTISVAQEVRNAINNFKVDIYKTISFRAKDHCVFSPLTLWLTLAAMAEGSEGLAQQELFKVLNLPEDASSRHKFYEFAIKSDISSDGVTMHSVRVLATDESLQLNPYWYNSVQGHALLDTVSVPIRRDPAAAVDSMRKLIAARIPDFNLAGNSLLLGSFDYHGMLSSVFSDAIISQAPFYNDFGAQIGTVEMMTIKKRAVIAYLPEQQLKVVVLPVGKNARYCVMISFSVGTIRKSIQTVTASVVPDILSKMRLSLVPIEISIPRYSMTTELDIRGILEDMGIRRLWTDPLATRNISTPAAFPSSFIHRATITVNNADAKAESYKEASLKTNRNIGVIDEVDTGVHPNFGRDFIANRPFTFGFFDTESYICIFASIFSRPPDGHVSID